MKLFVPKVLIVSLALLTACSGPGETPTSTPVPTSEPTAAPAPGNTTKTITLPADEGIHLAPVEWWYFNGHLEDPDGNEYSFHFVTFVTVTADGLIPQLLQLSWADHQEGVYLTDEKPALVNGLQKTKGTFDFQLAGWGMAGDGSDYRLSFDTGGYALELRASSQKSASLHQGTGLVDLGKAGKTRYYSRSRLAVDGTLSQPGTAKAVSGSAWMDHQWGDFSVLPVGWDWASIQLDNASELMVSLVRDAADGQPINTYGTYIPASAPGEPPADGIGTIVNLPGDQIHWTATGAWTSPATGAEYPQGWNLKVDSIDLELNLTPRSENSEFANSVYVPAAYWEGAVSVTGTKEGEPITGMGFVELVGYDKGFPAGPGQGP